jgi:hypothetical protein
LLSGPGQAASGLSKLECELAARPVLQAAVFAVAQQREPLLPEPRALDVQ